LEALHAAPTTAIVVVKPCGDHGEWGAEKSTGEEEEECVCGGRGFTGVSHHQQVYQSQRPLQVVESARGG